MKPNESEAPQRRGKLTHVKEEHPNWIVIAGGVLLSTLSVRLGCKLKQAFEARRRNDAVKARRMGACQLHSNLYHFTLDQSNCYYCLSGNGVDINQAPCSPASKEVEQLSLPLVKVSVPESSKESGIAAWTSSAAECVEPPRKPLLYSNSSGSPCFSESGSDIYGKTEVVQKLRQQLKRRDNMIAEMQAQIAELSSSLTIHSTQSANLQSQLEAANRDLFDAECEIQRLRKIIADHCAAEVVALPDQPLATRNNTNNWQVEMAKGRINGHMNGYHDAPSGMTGADRRRSGDDERVEMLRREVGELKEVIEGQEFLLQSYKEQKAELSLKVTELQQKLAMANRAPNIL